MRDGGLKMMGLLISLESNLRGTGLCAPFLGKRADFGRLISKIGLPTLSRETNLPPPLPNL